MTSSKKDQQIQRAQSLLTLLVRKYLHQGQPVSSKSIAQDPEVTLSAATIRHVMADLEAEGLLISPHTSAGRIPTAAGLRVFVDALVMAQAQEGERVPMPTHSWEEQLSARSGNVESLIKSTSSLLSQVTQLAGLVTLPKRNEVTLRHLEFLPLSGGRILVIMVVNEKEVQNRIIQVDRDYSPGELELVSNYFNEHFSGKPLASIQSAIVTAMHEDEAKLNEFMKQTLTFAHKAIDGVPQEEDYVLAGENHLLSIGETGGMASLRRVFNAFTQKRDILYLLNQATQASGVQIFIGQESGYEPLEDCSMVTAPYGDDRQVLGVLAVVGPTRMHYDRVIPIVDVTANLLSKALKEG